MIFTLIAALATSTAVATFPQSLQWTWARNSGSCEAELTNGIVIRSNTVSYYDGPERLTKVNGAITWKSNKGKAATYLMTFVTATSPGMGRDSGRGKPYQQKYTLIGNYLYVTDAKVAASALLGASVIEQMPTRRHACPAACCCDCCPTIS